MCKISSNKPAFIKRSLGCIAAIVALACAFGEVRAESPTGCNGTAPILAIVNVSPTVTTNGGVVSYEIKFQNDPGFALNACDLQNTLIEFACPNALGQPGTFVTRVTGLDIPAGTGVTSLPSNGVIQCTINVGSANAATAMAHSVGTLLSDPTVFPSEDTRPFPVTVRHPCIDITKSCTDGDCEDGIIAYNGNVLNCGDTVMLNVQVKDVVDSVETIVTNVSSLAPGGSFTYSSTYVATHSPSTNFATVTATAAQVGGTYSDTASAICTLSGTPCINVTKECQQTTAGGTITFNGVVQNCGNITLYDVTVNDSHVGNVGTISSLAPSGTFAYNGSYVPTACPATNVVTASGTASQLCGGDTVSATATAVCGSGAAGITVTKNCDLTGDCDTPTVDFSGVVRNNGSVPLKNVAVVDSIVGSLTLSATTLAPGGTATFNGSYTMVDNPSTNTVQATGEGDAAGISCGGSNVSAQANCIVPISGTPCIEVTRECEIQTGETTMLVHGTVRNCGDMTLSDVIVTDTQCGVVIDLASMAPGASSNWSCIVEISCPGIHNGTATATGYDRTICASDEPGAEEQVTDSASSSCTCELAGCRTTGGGKQPQSDTCPEVRYVTHGGQVGAAFGSASAPDCNTGYNNVCIRGEYQHVRHIKGGLRGTFHAAGNGHEHNFDSLKCACLPCDFTTTPPPSNYTRLNCHPNDRHYSEDALVDGLCHPGERLCGPEPRKAPANKIAFSGVGDYTETQGKKTPQSVVFRVDLEDRSEPGGAHPKGGKAPPDRYRMRMWFISGDSNSAYNKALRHAVAVHDPLNEAVLTTLSCLAEPVPTPEPDIDDGGDLDRGNRQIHPSTSASCH